MRRRRAVLEVHDASGTLSNPELVFATFLDCLQEGDWQAAREVLAAGLDHMNKSRVSRRYGIPRRSIYNLLTRRSAPNLELVAKACRAIREESGRKDAER